MVVSASRPRSPMSSYLIAGVCAGVAGLLTFLIIHHFWIRPIWFVLPVGLVIAGLGGLAVGWSYAEIHLALPARPWTGLALTGLIALILAPSIVLGEFRPPLIDLASFSIPAGEGGRAAAHFFLELVLPAVAVGSLLGWLLARTPQAAFSTALAGLVYALGPGHNLPFLSHTPAAGKGLLLLGAITLVSAVVLVEVNAGLARQ